MSPTAEAPTVGRPARSILYASPFNLFDVTSGASLSIRTLLAGLVGAGWRAAALQAMIFDSPEGGERVRAIANQHPDKKFIETEVDGVRHVIARTVATSRGAMTSAEEQGYFHRLRSEIARHRPDMVMLWGNMLLERAIVALARSAGIPTVFYLANPQYRSNDAFAGFSLVVTDSEATARLYRERNGIQAVPVGKFIDARAVKAAQRVPKYFTYVTPAIPKGIAVFAALAARARAQLPGVRFLVVEGRGKWADALGSVGYSPDEFPNVEVLGAQRDMRRVYAQTRALLLPSLWHESGARVIPEALLNGIPVLAADTGGSAELLGDGGFLFEVPRAVREHPTRRVADDVVEPWLREIGRLAGDEAFYAQACGRAERAAAAHELSRSVGRFAAAAEEVLGAGVGGLSTIEPRTAGEAATTIGPRSGADAITPGHDDV